MAKDKRFLCIAVDMGASNIRIMVGFIEDGVLSYRELHRFRNEIINLDGHERWDIEAIETQIIEGINMAIREYGNEITSLGVDSWGVDFALLDTSGKLLEQPISYRDKRTEGMEKIWADMMSTEETFQRTGINYYIFNTLFQLLSIGNSDLWKNADKLAFIPNYIQYRLSGVCKNELTIASTSQLMDVNSANWDNKILNLLNIPGHIMGEVCMPGSILGNINHQLLLPNAMKSVAVCAHDTASAVMSVPSEDPSYVFISTGTWCIVGIESATPILSKEAFSEGFTNERGYNNTYRFLKNLIGLWLVQGLMQEMPEGTSYSEVESLARASESSRHLILPDDPSFFNPVSMKTAFKNFFLKTGQNIPDDMGSYFKCAYHSLIYSFRYNIEQIEKMTEQALGTIHLIGGGSRSEFLGSETAGICRRKVISGPVEGATIGNILVQAIAMNKVSGLAQAREIVIKSSELTSYQPGAEKEQYTQDYERFLSFMPG